MNKRNGVYLTGYLPKVPVRDNALAAKSAPFNFILKTQLAIGVVQYQAATISPSNPKLLLYGGARLVTTVFGLVRIEVTRDTAGIANLINKRVCPAAIWPPYAGQTPVATSLDSNQCRREDGEESL
jgi:hypothetical protein